MGQTIGEAIGVDHDLFDEYYQNIRNTSDEAAKARWRNQLTWTIARHAISEELTMYPAMGKYLGDEGKRLAATDKEQHAAVTLPLPVHTHFRSLTKEWRQVKKQLAEIQDMTTADPNFQSLLDRLMDVLHHHIEHERQEDIPKLEAILPREESEALARSFENTKRIVPTQSHPSAPTSYIFENLAAMMTAPIDRFKDLLLKDFPDYQDRMDAEKLREQASE